ncbi:hypothetical protein Tco_0491847 [Tanacetum coccineum]
MQITPRTLRYAEDNCRCSFVSLTFQLTKFITKELYPSRSAFRVSRHPAWSASEKAVSSKPESFGYQSPMLMDLWQAVVLFELAWMDFHEFVLMDDLLSIGNHDFVVEMNAHRCETWLYSANNPGTRILCVTFKTIIAIDTPWVKGDCQRGLETDQRALVGPDREEYALIHDFTPQTSPSCLWGIRGGDRMLLPYLEHGFCKLSLQKRLIVAFINRRIQDEVVVPLVQPREVHQWKGSTVLASQSLSSSYLQALYCQIWRWGVSKKGNLLLPLREKSLSRKECRVGEAE